MNFTKEDLDEMCRNFQNQIESLKHQKNQIELGIDKLQGLLTKAKSQKQYLIDN